MKRIAPLILAALAAGLALASPAQATDATPTPTVIPTVTPTVTPTATPTVTAPATPTIPATPKDCAAYLYTGTKQTLCDRFANAADVKCAQVGFRVTLVDKNVDPWGLDGSGGGDRGVIGVGCESNPLKPVVRSSPTASARAVAAGSQLPVTGTPIGVMVGGAAGLLLLGGGAYAVARRRRTRFVA